MFCDEEVRSLSRLRSVVVFFSQSSTFNLLDQFFFSFSVTIPASMLHF